MEHCLVKIAFLNARGGKIGIVITQKVREGFSKDMLMELTPEGGRSADSSTVSVVGALCIFKAQKEGQRA